MGKHKEPTTSRLLYESKYYRAEVNKFRQNHGLAPIEKVERQCLKCNSKFESLGAFMRMCPACRQRMGD